MELKVYKKENDYSFAFGAFPTLELLLAQPKQIVKILVSEKLENSTDTKAIFNLAKENNTEIVTNSKLVEKLSQKGNVFVVGVFKKYKQILENNKNQIVLVNPQDAGNLDTIMRQMLGIGYNNLAIILPAVDMFDPKTVRSSMGAVFGLNVQTFKNFDEYEKQNKLTFYPFMLNGKTKLQLINDIKYPHSLIFGNEASGLDKNFLNIGESVVIEHSSQIDSLNLAISTGIAMYEFSKQKNSH
jgi:TrmH family RNA methyltransferase